MHIHAEALDAVRERVRRPARGRGRGHPRAPARRARHLAQVRPGAARALRRRAPDAAPRRRARAAPARRLAAARAGTARPRGCSGRPRRTSASRAARPAGRSPRRRSPPRRRAARRSPRPRSARRSPRRRGRRRGRARPAPGSPRRTRCPGCTAAPRPRRRRTRSRRGASWRASRRSRRRSARPRSAGRRGRRRSAPAASGSPSRSARRSGRPASRSPEVVARADAVEEPLVLRRHQLAVPVQQAVRARAAAACCRASPGRSRSRSLTPIAAWMPCARARRDELVDERPGHVDGVLPQPLPQLVPAGEAGGVVRPAVGRVERHEGLRQHRELGAAAGRLADQADGLLDATPAASRIRGVAWMAATRTVRSSVTRQPPAGRGAVGSSPPSPPPCSRAR